MRNRASREVRHSRARNKPWRRLAIADAIDRNARILVNRESRIFTSFYVSATIIVPNVSTPAWNLHNRRRGSSRSGLTKRSADPALAKGAGEMREADVAGSWRADRDCPALRPVPPVSRRSRGPRRRQTAGPYRQAWSRPLAAAGRVEIWFVPAGAHALLAQHARVLGRDDWSAIARVRDETARNHLRATRITLRRALSHAVGNAVKPEAWRFETTAYGKPQVAARAAARAFLHFPY